MYTYMHYGYVYKTIQRYNHYGDQYRSSIKN